MNKTAIYCRVSTEGQEQDGTSLNTQLDACLKYCEARRYEVVARYSEAFSGLSLERPRLSELRDLVQSEAIDSVVVYSLDRFSRDPVHGVILMQELEKHGVTLEAATETVDNSEVGKLVFYIKGYAAKLDAERRRDATGRGKKAMLKAGKLPQGTGIGLYGYSWVSEYKKRIPVESEAGVVQRIFEMVAQDKSCYGIAQTLNKESIPTRAGKRWEAVTVSRLVRNPAYCGLTYFGRTKGGNGTRERVPEESWVLLPDTTQAIVEKELFDRAQAALARSRELRPGRALHEYPLTGVAYCGYCGSPLVGSCLRGDYRYYHCRGTYDLGKGTKGCKARYIRAAWLEEVVWEKVKAVLSQPELLLAEVRGQVEAGQEVLSTGDLDREVAALKRKLKKYPAQERRLVSAFKLGFTPDVVLDEMNQTKKEKEADEARLAQLMATKDNLAKANDLEAHLRELCSRIVPDLDNCTVQDKKDAFRYLDLRVTATQEGVDIKGYVQPQLLTIEQTSALSHARSCPCQWGERRRGSRGLSLRGQPATA
jgi:site-specific DNA recombinase